MIKIYTLQKAIFTSGVDGYLIGQDIDFPIFTQNVLNYSRN